MLTYARNSLSQEEHSERWCIYVRMSYQTLGVSRSVIVVFCSTFFVVLKVYRVLVCCFLFKVFDLFVSKLFSCVGMGLFFFLEILPAFCFDQWPSLCFSLFVFLCSCFLVLFPDFVLLF